MSTREVAAPTGIAVNDTAAIISAIAAATVNGDMVKFAAGIYLINAQILLMSNRVYFSTDGTIIRAAAASSIDWMFKQAGTFTDHRGGIAISGITFDANQALCPLLPGRGILDIANHPTNYGYTIENCTFLNSRRWAMAMTNASATVASNLRNLTFDYCDAGLLMSVVGVMQNIHLEDVTISHYNYIDPIAGTQIAIGIQNTGGDSDNITLSTSAHPLILNNERSARFGIEVTNVAYYSHKRILLDGAIFNKSGNHVDAAGVGFSGGRITDSTFSNCRFNCDVGNVDGNFHRQGFEIFGSGNVIENNSGTNWGITVDASAGSVSTNNLIRNNSFEMNSTGGYSNVTVIGVGGQNATSNCNDFLIEHNSINFVPDGSANVYGNGILVGLGASPPGAINNCVIRQNTLTGIATKGIATRTGGSGKISNLAINCNSISDALTGIDQRAICAGLTVSGNVLKSNMSVGIHVESTDSKLLNNHIDAATAMQFGSNILGTHIISNNISISTTYYIQNTSAVSVQSINNFRTSTTTIGPLTSVNDTVVIDFELAADLKPLPSSPCIAAGIFVGNISDATGMKFHNPPSVGAYEFKQLTPRALRLP